MIHENIHQQKIYVNNNEIRFVKINERNHDKKF